MLQRYKTVPNPKADWFQLKLNERLTNTNVILLRFSQPIESGEIKEEDRLAAIVQIITEEAAVVPRGGLFKQTDSIVVHSRAFEGLKVDEADELCSFLHYRTPQRDCNTNLLTRVDYNYAMDFLDTIDKDLPEVMYHNIYNNSF